MLPPSPDPFGTAAADVLSVPVFPMSPMPFHPSEPPAQPASLIDWATLRGRYPGREVFIRKLVAMVRADPAMCAEKLERAVQSRDLPAIAQIAHRLKGACGNVGANAVAQQAARIQAQAGAGDAAVLDGIDAFSRTIIALAAEIDAYLQDSQPH